LKGVHCNLTLVIPFDKNMARVKGAAVIGNVLAEEDLDPISNAILRVEKLEAERHNLVLSLTQIAKAAQDLLAAGDAFQLVCGSLTKDAKVQSDVDSHKFMSSLQLVLATESKSFANFLKIGVLPFLNYVSELNYDDLKKAAQKNATKKRKGIDDFVRDVEGAVETRDRHLWKLLSSYLQSKGKHYEESSGMFDRHRAVIEAFDSSLNGPRVSHVRFSFHF
jgi:hypothetical protein